MKVVRYLFASLAFQLSFPFVSGLEIQKPAAETRPPDTSAWVPDTDDLTGLLREPEPSEEPEAIDRHELLVSVAALRVPSKAWRLYEKGLEARKREDFDKALQNFEAALKAYPDFAAALAAQGTTLLWQKKIAEAQEAFLKALALDEQTFEAELGLGLALNATGQFEGAIDHLRKALYLNGECWQVRYALGRAYYGSGQYLQAELNLKLAGAWRPKYANVYLLLGLVLLMEDKPTEALTAMETFLTVSPEDPLAGQVREKIQEFRQSETE